MILAADLCFDTMRRKRIGRFATTVAQVILGQKHRLCPRRPGEPEYMALLREIHNICDDCIATSYRRRSSQIVGVEIQTDRN
jgi:hypothetical protein